MAATVPLPLGATSLQFRATAAASSQMLQRNMPEIDPCGKRFQPQVELVGGDRHRLPKSCARSPLI